MRFLKILGIVLALILVLVVVAAGALWFGGGEAVAWAIAHPVSRMLGRQITVAHSRLDWGNPSHLTLEDVHVANASWGSRPEMVTARRIEVTFFARSFIWGPPRIPEIGFEGASLLFETSEKGDRNWDFGLKAAAPQKRHQFPDLEHLVAHHSEILWRNGETKAEDDIGVASLEAKAPNPAAPVTVALDGTFQKHPMRLAATVGPLAHLRDTSQPYPVKIDGGLDEVKLTVDGTIAEPLDVSGVDVRLSLAGRKLHEIADLIKVPLPELPDFKGTSELVGGDGKWELKALSMQTGKSDLEGGLAIDTTQKVPYVKAELTSKSIELGDFAGVFGASPDHASAPAKKAPDPGGRILPDTKIDVSKLPGLNADLTFDATRIRSTSGLPFERISLGLKLKDGELTVKPLRFHAAQGDVDLNLHLTPFTQNSPPKVDGGIDIRHVDLHQLLGAQNMPQMLRETRGIVGGFVKLDTSGTSLRELLGHMNGDAGLFMQDGRLSRLLEQLAPIDVLGALGVYVNGDHPTQINCFISRFDIKAGVATATTLLLDTNDDTVVGGGNLNFADETLRLSLTPYNKSFTTVTLRTPVDVDGTFGKPGYHLRAGGLVARLGAAVGLGILFPPAALLPLVDVGLGEQNACSKAYAQQKPPGDATPKTGSSAQPKAGTPPRQGGAVKP